MFKVTRVGPNRVDIELRGKLDGEDMRVALDELSEKSKDIEHGCMLYRITDFDWPAFSIIVDKISRLPGLFGLIGKFDRIAVLADKAWIRKAGEIEGALIPGLQIRSFDIGDVDKAQAWLSG